MTRLMNNNIPNFNVNIDLSHNIALSHFENFSNSTSSIYDDTSPQHLQTSTPPSNDSLTSEKHNQSTLSSKKSEISILSNEENGDLTVDSLERTLTNDRVSKIKDILLLIERLNDAEKMLLQLRFPLREVECRDENDNNIEDFNMGANLTEHTEALAWVMTHLEEDTNTCLKKQEVYDDYKSYCLSHAVKYLSTADFGKVMKKAFPTIKARRLGARGQSKYCYSGLKNRNEIKAPMIIDVGANCNSNDNKVDDRNSGRNSVSSNSQHPDLSNIPEYELSHNILVDSALVIIDFIKRVGIRKEVTSLKQAVEHLLLNNQVEMRTPHVMRLLSHFPNINKSKRSTISTAENQRILIPGDPLEFVDNQLKSIKKEETVSNPHSPKIAKRHKLSYMSPMSDKVVSYYDQSKVSHAPQPLSNNQSYCPPQNHSYNYGMSSNHSTQPYYNDTMLNIPSSNARSFQNPRPITSPLNKNAIGQKQFLPNTFSTPIKDLSNKIISPTLDSPLLLRNPTTTKKLELSNSSKSNHQNNSVNYSGMQHRTPERPPRMPVYNSGYNYDNPLSNTSIPGSCSQEVNSYMEREPPSPMQMTSRNYNTVTYDDEYEFDAEVFNVTLPLKRHIGSELSMNFDPCQNFTGDNDYSNLNTSGYHQQSCEEKDYLDTPSNSPTYRSVEQEPSGGSSRTHTPQTYSNLMTLKDTLSESLKRSPYLDHNPDITFTSAGTNDEFSVTSTTNTCPPDNDGHPSTTMFLFK